MAEGEAKFIITLEVTVPNEEGYTYVDPVKWNWSHCVQVGGQIKNARIEILNISPIRNVDLPDDAIIFYDGAERERREWEESRG